MLLKLYVRLQTLFVREEGQTTAEYALVILAAVAVAVVLIAWAKSSGKSGLASFQVSGSASGAVLPAASQSISMVEQAANTPRFSVQPTTLQQGWTLIRNDTPTLHQVVMFPVDQGTTVQEVISCGWSVRRTYSGVLSRSAVTSAPFPPGAFSPGQRPLPVP